MTRDELIAEAQSLQAEMIEANKAAREARDALSAAMARRGEASTRLNVLALALAEHGETLESIEVVGEPIAYPMLSRAIADLMATNPVREMKTSQIVQLMDGYSDNSIRQALGAMKRAGAIKSIERGWWRLVVDPENVGQSARTVRKRSPAADWVIATLRSTGKGMKVGVLEAMAPEELRKSINNAVQGLIVRGVLQRTTRGTFYFAMTEVEDDTGGAG